MLGSIQQVMRKVTSRIVFFFFLISTPSHFRVGQSTFCPVTSPNDEVVYVTGTPTKLMIGASKTGCAIDCISSNCRCINYNVTSLNCSVFNFEPKSYAVDKSNNTVAYQLISKPLTDLWSTVPVTNCSFPFVYQRLKYCGCRRGVMFPKDHYCRKSYYSCQLKNGNPAYCDVGRNPPMKTPGCDLNSFCKTDSATLPCSCNPGYIGDGFTCTTVQSECVQNSLLLFMSASGTLASMNYPNKYINDADCRWIIMASDPYGIVRLSFTAFCIEDSFDYVRVYDGSSTSSPVLMSLSGCSGLPSPVTTTQHYMYVTSLPMFTVSTLVSEQLTTCNRTSQRILARS